MGKILVIAEKPSVGKDCADYLGCREKHKGYIEGDKYIVTWAVGHLIALKNPEEYNPDWQIWDIDKLPMIPQNFDLKVAEATKEQFYIVKKLINRPDVVSLVNAGDSAREGELIQRYIYNMAGNTKPVKRLWISSTTRAAIAEGFANLKDSSEFDSLYESALARAHIDWLYGMNYTRAFTKKFDSKTVLSTGRCQTPILKIIVDRDKEIDNFVSTPYYEIVSDFGEYIGKYVDKDGVVKLEDKEKAKNIINSIKNKKGVITDINKEHKSVPAPQLYNLNSLAQKMNMKYGYTAQKTLDILQRLYEVHKIATYPRASAKVMSDTIFNEMKSHINYISFGEFAKYIPNLNIKKTKRYVDDTKIEDHHAIIPDFKNSRIPQIYPTLNQEEKSVFDELVKSVLAAFLPYYEYDITFLVTNVDGYEFLTKGKQITNLGWKSLYMDEKEIDDGTVDLNSQLKKGEYKYVVKAEILSKMTKPKPRYTEGKILEVMAKYGIGTQATQGTIIETLKKRKYIECKGKSLISTQLGKDFIEIIPIEEIKSVELTAELEEELSKIVDNKATRSSLETKVINKINDNINKIKMIEKSISTSTSNSLGKCPLCGGAVIKNKRGDYGCLNYKEGCKFYISEICHKKLTESQIKQLLEKGETNIIKGFISKSDKKFDAKLKFNNQTKKVEFNFDKSNGKKIICPKCGKEMVNSEKVCKCDDCGILIFKTIAGKKLTDSQVKQLLEKGITNEIKGFTSKNGKEFSAKLKLEDGKVKFDFN